MLCPVEKGAVTNDNPVVPYSLIRKKANVAPISHLLLNSQLVELNKDRGN